MSFLIKLLFYRGSYIKLVEKFKLFFSDFMKMLSLLGKK